MTEPVVYIDLTNLVEDLTTISELTPQQIAENILDDLGERIVGNAKQIAPVRTGVLRDSIGYSVKDGQLEIETGVDYAEYQEFGTGTRGEYPTGEYTIVPKRSKYLRFTVNGRTVYTKKVVHPGVPAHPFLRPAAIMAIGDLMPKLLDRGEALIRKGPNSAL